MAGPAPSLSPRSRLRLQLLLVLLVGWAILIWGLDERSLWVDEYLTAQAIQGSWLDVIAHAAGDIHPPLYFLAVHAWTLVAGSGDFALRWFSVAASMLTIALVPAVARRLFDAHVALLAAGLMALSPPLVEFGRMARYYSLLALFGLLSTRFLLDALSTRRVSQWLGYALSSLVLLYTFYPTAVLLVAQGLCLVAPRRRLDDLARWLTVASLVALAFGPWFVLAAGAQLTSTAANAGVDFTRSILGWLLGIGASFYTFAVGEGFFPWFPLAWLGALLVLVALFEARHSRSWRPVASLCLLSVAALSFVTTYISTGTPFLNVPVRALFVLPFVLMLIAAGLAHLRPSSAYALLASLALVWLLSNVNQFTGDQYLNPIYLTPSKQAAAFVRARLSPRDLVVSDEDSVVGRYLPPSDQPPWHLYTGQPAQVQSIISREQPPRVWLITIGRDQSERLASAQPVRDLLTDNYRLSSTFALLPLDPTYVRFKDLVLHRSTYQNRLTIELYLRL